MSLYIKKNIGNIAKLKNEKSIEYLLNEM